MVKINGKWVKEWGSIWESIKDTLVWTKWEKTYDSTEIVSGISLGAIAYCESSVGWESATFWIDDVYIGGMEVGVEEDSRLQIADYKVEISPNPFIQSTTIKYHLPTKSKVSLEIYDITGRTVKTLVNEKKETGSYDISFDARDLTAGIYFAKLVVDGVKQMRKLTILR